MTQRTNRIDELLQQEIGDLIAREIADPAVGFVTVTDVETAPDLRHARVWVSVIGQPDQRQASVDALQRAMPYVRAQLGRRLRLKRIPEFSVRLDESMERGARVLQLLNELEAGASPDEPSVGESLPTPRPRIVREGESEDEGDAEAASADSSDSGPASSDAAGRPSGSGAQPSGGRQRRGDRRRPAIPGRPSRRSPPRGHR